ncbi:hypothetical protein [Nocardioides taihuensis]|uniref:ATP-binding protein n=1 Tax=Nocardioides taihuensis TaxID=1835606 RepID=A0ABW0BKJ5_9ACTN
MSEEDLHEALKPVQQYLRSSDINVNTVLAAHMRALGLVPNGDAWQLARSALRAGASFADAALAGAGDGAVVPVPNGEAPGRPKKRRPLTAATELTRARTVAGPMDWYPQRFDPGAIQGDGAKKLLGTPHVSMEEMLVRETAQNSWDARTGERPVEFVLNVRELSQDAIDCLATDVFTGEAPGTDLRRALDEDDLWAIEISDRGTVGLGGPVRNDLTIPEGSVTHFIDLIFNIGATKNDPTSGGTYGFGKSIAYMVSELGAVLVWSRCRTDAGVEDRLIASAIGEVFDMGGGRYTGRHWWGRVVDQRPEPLIGERARELAERVFSKKFVGGELGTSLLILEPRLGLPGPTDDADVLVDSVLWNLWPKLLPDTDGTRAMEIGVQSNGVEVPIPNPADHPILAGYVACLQAVRAEQEGREPPQALFKTEVVEIKRYNEVLGHLGLIKFPASSLGSSDGDDQRSPSRSVALMRHGAELVVRHMERQALSESGFQWAGVFKPVAALDGTFAASEPPAHDDWSPTSLTNKVQRSQVRLALERIRKEADAFVAPSTDTPVRGESLSTAAVGDMLSSFMGGVIGSAPSTRRGSGGGGARSSRPSVAVEPVEWAAADRPGWTRTTLRVSVAGGDPTGTAVALKVRVGTDGRTEKGPQPDYIRELGWNGSEATESSTMIKPGMPQTYVFESRDDIAIDVTSVVANGAGA